MAIETREIVTGSKWLDNLINVAKRVQVRHVLIMLGLYRKELVFSIDFIHNAPKRPLCVYLLSCHLVFYKGLRHFRLLILGYK